MNEAFGNEAGIVVDGNSTNIMIGGIHPEDGNAIANSRGGDGVSLRVDAGSNIPILSNSIYMNSGKGIRDDRTLPTQAAPTIERVEEGSIIIVGNLSSDTNTSVALQFFGDLEGAGAGGDEGRGLLGTMNVMTDGSGMADFMGEFDPDYAKLYPSNVADHSMPITIQVTATVTNLATGNTSEFAQHIPFEIEIGNGVAANYWNSYD